jgi:hypothetical protein
MVIQHVSIGEHATKAESLSHSIARAVADVPADAEGRWMWAQQMKGVASELHAQADAIEQGVMQWAADD